MAIEEVGETDARENKRSDDSGSATNCETDAQGFNLHDSTSSTM